MKTKKAKSKPKTSARQKAKGCRRPSRCSPLGRLKDAIEAGKIAHRETHKEHLCWRRLMTVEHEAIACAVVAHVLDIPASFVHGVLDLQMGRVEEMENAADQGAAVKPRSTNKGE